MPTKHMEKNARWELHKNAMYCFEQILEATSYKTAAVQPTYLGSLWDKKMNKTCRAFC